MSSLIVDDIKIYWGNFSVITTHKINMLHVLSHQWNSLQKQVINRPISSSNFIHIGDSFQGLHDLFTVIFHNNIAEKKVNMKIFSNKFALGLRNMIKTFHFYFYLYTRDALAQDLPFRTSCDMIEKDVKNSGVYRHVSSFTREALPLLKYCTSPGTSVTTVRQNSCGRKYISTVPTRTV